ncbi:MFS transporter [Spirillospora sp. NBC_00431]
MSGSPIPLAEPTSGSTPVALQGRAVLALSTLVAGLLIFTTLGAAVVPGLARYQADLGISPSAAAWLFTGFLLSSSIATPAAGRLGDMYGKRRALVWLFVVMGAGALIGGLATGLPAFIIGQLLLGTGGGVYPLAFAIAREELPRDSVAVAIGLLGGIATAGGLLGFLVGGRLADAYSNRWLLAAAALLLLLALISRVTIPSSRVRVPGSLDWLGMVLFGGPIAALLLAITFAPDHGWTSRRVLLLTAAGAIGLAVWTSYEARRTQPFIDIDLLRRRFMWAPCLIALVVGFSTVVVFVVVPQLVVLPRETGYGFGGSTTQAGLYLIPTAIVFLIAGPAAGVLERSIGPRPVIVLGVAVMALPIAALARWHDEPWHIIVSSSLVGAGYGLAFTTMTSMIVRAVDAEHTGVATGISTIARTIGETLGTQVGLSIIAANINASTQIPEQRGFSLAFVVGAAVAVIAVLAALAVPRKNTGGF